MIDGTRARSVDFAPAQLVPQSREALPAGSASQPTSLAGSTTIAAFHAAIGTVIVGTEKVLTLSGTNFFPEARVLLNGAEVPSKFIDSQTIEATIAVDRLPLVPQTDQSFFPLH